MKNVIAFVLGGTVGSLITWKLLEKKYKDIANEEIEAVREHYRSKLEPVCDMANEVSLPYANTEEFKEDKSNYNKIITDLGYVSDDATLIVNQGEEGVAPYVISPDEYGDLPGYDTDSFTYYADGIVANDDYEIIDDLDNLIGDGLMHFGEFEDDAVHVRNENLKCDYEILKHENTFEEISARMG